MIIRPATEADLPMINTLIRQQENRFLEELTLPDIKDPLNISFIAAQDDAEKPMIFAFGQARQIETTDADQQTGELIQTIFVAVDHERTVAAQFMEQWLLEAKKRKIKRVDFNSF